MSTNTMEKSRSFPFMAGSVAVILCLIGVCTLYTSGATVTVESNVPAARIRVDGQAQNGPSATFEKMPFGTRQISVTHAEYKPYEGPVQAGWLSRQTRVSVELRPLPVELTVRTTPGAEVFLDETSLGRTGSEGVLVKQDVLPGDHQISVKFSGHNEWRERRHLSPPGVTLYAYLQVSAEKIREVENNRVQVAQNISAARRLFASRNYQDALGALRAALAIDPQNSEAKSLRDQVEQTTKILGGK